MQRKDWLPEELKTSAATSTDVPKEKHVLINVGGLVS